jgi:hypothetical protein
MSNIINNLTLHKTLEYWSPHKFTNIINWMNSLYNSTIPNNKIKYDSYIKILKSSKNFTGRVEDCITEIWNDSVLQKKLYHNIWREFVNNFETSERTLIVNEIHRIIIECATREALSVSKNNEEELKKENERLKQKLIRLQNKNNELRRILIELQ